MNIARLLTALIASLLLSASSGLKQAKENGAQQQVMVQQITRAVDGMISRATVEIEHHLDQQEVIAAVRATNAVQQGFRHDILPYAKTFPLRGFDLGPLDDLIHDARKVIETLYDLLAERAKTGDGAACIIIYRNLHAVVQCKLAMDKWRRGVTLPVITQAEYEMRRLSELWVPFNLGLARMSDLSFSPGIVHFHVGGGGRPEFTKYSYYYQGQVQPVNGPNMAPVSQAFGEARQAARTKTLPPGITDWQNHADRVLEQLQELKKKVPA